MHTFLLEEGVSAGELLARTGLTEADLAEPHNIISLTQARTYYLNAVALSDTGAGLEIGYATSLSETGLRGLSLSTSKTVREALEDSQPRQHYYELMGSSRVKFFEKVAVYYINVTDESESELSRFYIERGIGTIQAHTEELCGPEAKPTRLLLNYPKPSNFKRYHEIFCCPILFDQACTELHYPAEYFDYEIKSYDPQSQPVVAQMRDNLLATLTSCSSVAEEIAQYLRRQKGRLPDVNQTAEYFSISPRTLRRKLASNETSYQKLLDAERRRRAEYLLLNTTANIKAISTRIGYNDPQNFSQAFKHWTGISPGEYRKTHSAN